VLVLDARRTLGAHSVVRRSVGLAWCGRAFARGAMGKKNSEAGEGPAAHQGDQKKDKKKKSAAGGGRRRAGDEGSSRKEPSEFVIIGNGQSLPDASAAEGSKGGWAQASMGEVIVPEKKAPVSWDDKVKMLEDFNQLHGHVCVPKHDSELGWWVQQCRHMHNSGKMPEDKRVRLERLGFVWCGQEAKRIREQAEGKTVSSWDDRFRALMDFREVHGHTSVPMQRNDPGLGAWVKEQRSLYNAGKLQEERKQKLMSIGFIFDGAEAKRVRELAEGKTSSTWDDKFAMLEKFKVQHGHTCVPLQRQDPGLGCWVREQRSLYNSGKLQEVRREKLESIGFIFDGSEAKKVREQSEGKACHSWNDKFKLLESFKEKHGHTCVPKQEAELGWWVQQCRQLFNNNKLADDKRERLEAIGFVFDGAEAKRVRDAIQGKPAGCWEDKLKLLVEFKAQNGHTCVAQKHPTLGFWVKEQRMALNKGRLSEERRQKLDELGFTWDARRKGDGDDGGAGGSSDGLRRSAGSDKTASALKSKPFPPGAKKNIKPIGIPMGLLLAQEAAARAAASGKAMVKTDGGESVERSADHALTSKDDLSKPHKFGYQRHLATQAPAEQPHKTTALGILEEERKRKTSLDFLCNPDMHSPELQSMQKKPLAANAHAVSTVAQPAAAHQRPDKGDDGAVVHKGGQKDAVHAHAIVVKGDTSDDGMEQVSHEAGTVVGSKRSISAVDDEPAGGGGREGNSGKAAVLGNGSRPKKKAAVLLTGTGTVVQSSTKMEMQGNALLIASAQEALKKSRDRCKILLEVLRSCQERLNIRCQANFNSELLNVGDTLLGCIPDIETCRNTIQEYHTTASQTLEAYHIISREKRLIGVNTEVQPADFFLCADLTVTCASILCRLCMVAL
jgi:hypothetical protein